MPTSAEFDDLLNDSNCGVEWVADYLSTGVSGYLFTSKVSGFEGQKIFLPAAGGRYDTSLYYVGSSGYYWSSSLRTDVPNYAWYVDFDSDGVGRFSNFRCLGLSVRPVSE